MAEDGINEQSLEMNPTHFLPRCVDPFIITGYSLIPGITGHEVGKQNVANYKQVSIYVELRFEFTRL